MVLVLPSKFSAPGGQTDGLDDDMAEEQLGQRPKTKEELLAVAFHEVIPRSESNKYRHLKPLYILAHVEGVPVSKVFVDCGATVNILPYSLMRKLDKSKEDLIPSDVVMSSFVGDKSKTIGVLPLKITVADQTRVAAFYVVESSVDYNILLGRDWIHQSGSLVEHELRIKEGFKPFQQPPRRFSTEVQLRVKEEIERLLKAGFIRTARYVEWLANIVPVLKRTGALRVCTDYRNLNLATPKDEYPMPMSDHLVDGAAKHKLLSFMDGHASYNQIFVAEEDVHKTAFRCPGAIGTYEWVVMPFGLKNAGATYQRAMNLIFHDLIGRTVEVYIDDVVVKSPSKDDNVKHLRQAFDRMRAHGLKMNPKKCAFGVTAGNFLGFLVHQRGIEVDKNKATAIMAAPPPRTKKELQSFLGKVNFLRRFISNLAGKIRPLSPLLKLKDTERFNNESGREQAVHYLSRTLNTAELYYSPIEKLCLALYFAATKLRHYMLPSVVQIISKTDLIKYMLTWPIIRGRIGKWTMALSEFTFQYVAQKSVKGQALADFLAHHPAQGQEEELEVEIGMAHMEKNYWTMHFDGSSTEARSGAGVVIESPQGQKWQFAFQLDFRCTNNQAEYEALIIDLEILKEMKATCVLVHGDFQLVINQLTGEYQCTSENLAMYYVTALNTADGFSRISFVHVPRAENGEANEMAQAQKQIAARVYNKRVKQKAFAEGDLVWRAVLPIGTKDPRFGKFSPNWEGPFIIERILGRGAFQLKDRDGEWHNLPINGQYLKRYTPSLWETAVKKL
ncbi:uncharacterized protein LOC110765743 [Prunus avium]|uniref:RNA-directed DNA polymerase n=1 Tax=Prunus avium TaxID=42229 RepID=A0A6P5TBJ1_PRUAV|nr:uncharacterized protein LOC110765743 [Prunus avium]